MMGKTRAEQRLDRRVLELAAKRDGEGVLYELERFEKSRCRARTRRGTACKCAALSNGRCKVHGGLSTGPKTLEGRVRALLNLRPYRHLKGAPAETIQAELGHLLSRLVPEPSRKPPKIPRPQRPRELTLVQPRGA